MKIFMTVLLIPFLISCSKSDPANQATSEDSVCNVVSAKEIRSSGTNIYNYFYDNQQRLSRVAFGSDIETFTYSGNKIYIEYDDGRLDTVTLNSSGLISQFVEADPGQIPGTTNYYYTNDLVDSSVEIRNSLSATTYYKFNNGDLAYQTQNGYTDTNTYYLDRPVTGHADGFNQNFYMGATMIKNKHMRKTFTEGTRFSNETYTFDNDGKVTSQVSDEVENPVTYYFTYECH